MRWREWYLDNRCSEHDHQHHQHKGCRGAWGAVGVRSVETTTKYENPVCKNGAGDGEKARCVCVGTRMTRVRVGRREWTLLLRSVLFRPGPNSYYSVGRRENDENMSHSYRKRCWIFIDQLFFCDLRNYCVFKFGYVFATWRDALHLPPIDSIWSFDVISAMTCRAEVCLSTNLKPSEIGATKKHGNRSGSEGNVRRRFINVTFRHNVMCTYG